MSFSTSLQKLNKKFPIFVPLVRSQLIAFVIGVHLYIYSEISKFPLKVWPPVSTIKLLTAVIYNTVG